MKAFVFPGQGSQYVGMSKKIPESLSKRKMFETASEIISEDLFEICENGPQEKLTSTDITQPALFTVSAIYDTLLKEKGESPEIVAGHSLGEYSALYSAHVISFEDGLKLTKTRGTLMKKISSITPGKMLAIIGLEADKINKLVEEASKKGVIATANYNAPDQVVLSGEISAVEEAQSLAKILGARLAKLLDVSAAFHSPLMSPIVEEMSRAIDACNFSIPKIPIVQNVSAEAEKDIGKIKENLKLQITGPVRWVETMLLLEKMGFNSLIEVGPKNVLKGLLEKTIKSAEINTCEVIFNA